MRLLVTGASGYVGAGILRRAPKEWNIAATYLAHRIERANVAAFCVDVRDAAAVNRLFTEFHPDVVIHTVALMSGNAMMTTNIDGSRNVARAAAQSFDSANASLRTRLIHISSDVIFDGEHAPYTENDAPAPITLYGESKARAEQVVKTEHANPVIVRTSLVYGCNPIDPRTRQTIDGEMPYLFTDEYRCPIFVDDLADALIEVALSLQAERSNPRSTVEIASSQSLRASRNDTTIIHIAGPQRMSRFDFGVTLANAFGVAIKFQPALSGSFATPRPRDCTLDISLAHRVLKTKLRGVDEVIAQMQERSSSGFILRSG